MGQYYKPINLDKKIWLYSHEFKSGGFGTGLKLMEHSWIGNHFVTFVENLLVAGNDWYKDRIVWAGDYADEEISEKTNIEVEKGKWELRNVNLYDLCDTENDPVRINAITKMPLLSFKKYIPNIEEQNQTICRVKTRFLCNFDKMEYVDYTKCPGLQDDPNEGWVWMVNPLPLLTCEGNGRGGGDYHSEYPGQQFVGSWARNRIGILGTLPRGEWEEIEPGFLEYRVADEKARIVHFNNDVVED